jgi:SAM-dependent methyltransferase
MAEQGELWDLQALAGARRLGDWMFDQFSWAVGPDVVEVGAGIGTFSARLLDAGVQRLLLIEPEPTCADILDERFAGDARVTVERDQLPEADALLARPGLFDLALCLNVLEHVADDVRALAVMAGALRPGGRLGLLVPAGPKLYGSLDIHFGHHRRYTSSSLRALAESAGLRVTALYPFNALGIPGWWFRTLTGGTALGSRSLAAYDRLLVPWRPLEKRLRLRWGLSLVLHAERPGP